MWRALIVLGISLAATAIDAAQYLKQSTAATLKIGPFVDDTDGKTAETALTLSQADFRISKNGGDFAQKNDSSSGTHDESGYYDVAVNATDTDALGPLVIAVHESGALPVRHDYFVVPANVYDSLASTDKLQVDQVQQQGTTVTEPPGIWFVDDGAAGAGTGYNPADAFTTVAAAISAARAFDTIYILNGTYTLGTPLTISKPLRLIGESRLFTKITYSGSSDATISAILAGNLTLQNLWIEKPVMGGGTQAASIKATGACRLIIDNCYMYGHADGIYCDTTFGLEIYNSTIESGYDAALLNGCTNIYARNAVFITDCTNLTGSAQAHACKILSDNLYTAAPSTGGTFENCVFAAKKTNSEDNAVIPTGINIGGANVRLVNPTFLCLAGTNNIGGMIAVTDGGDGITTASGRVEILGGRIVTTNQGTGTVRHFKFVNANSIAMVSGTEYDSTLVDGTIVDRGPTAANVNSAVEVGTVGVRALLALPAVAAGGNGGLPLGSTAFPNLAALNTAQNVEHDATQATLATIAASADAAKSASENVENMLPLVGPLASQADAQSGGTSTAGGLAFVAYVGSFEPNPPITDVIQGELKQLTIAVQAKGAFADPTPTAITVTVKDVDSNIATVANNDITRVCEDSSFQIIRFDLTAVQTAALSPGFLKIEVSFDSEKVQVNKTVRIVEGL